jgi:hypothetical protein
MNSKLLIRQTKYPKARHSGEGRNPEKHWMPDRACPGMLLSGVRHDEISIFNRRFDNVEIRFRLAANTCNKD